MVDITDLPLKFRQANAHLLTQEGFSESLTMAVDAPTRADKQSEKALERLCEAELMRRDIEYLHISHRAREKKGWPDLVFCHDGQPFAIELKASGGNLSDDQIRVLTRMKANGWWTDVVTTFEDFCWLLNRKERE